MFRCSIFNLSVAAVFSASTAIAAPISAESQLAMFHSWLVNNGNVPVGLDVINLSSTFFTDSNVTSAVDDPAAAETRLQNFVVGNPFADPVVPVQAYSLSRTNVPTSADNATAIYDYTIEMEDDPDQGVFDITRREIDQQGFARVQMTDKPVVSSAVSSHMAGRSFRFENKTNEPLSFNLTGLFSADLSASFSGADGFARTAGGFALEFDIGEGSDVTYFPVAPYLTTIVNDDPGTSVADRLLTNSGGITGINFNASVSAIATGGETAASFLGESRYVFGISLDPNASLLMRTSYNQINAVGVDPVTPVPLPAGLPLLLSSIIGFGILRHKFAMR